VVRNQEGNKDLAGERVMLEVLKQAYQLLLTEPHAPTVCNQLEVILRQAIAELESQEPVAWMHIMDNTEGIKANGAGIVSITQKRKHPFGKAGIDFSKSYLVTSTPLYTHPPQRTWQGLTQSDFNEIYDLFANKVSSDFIFEKMYSTIEAKLKERNL